MIKFSVRKTKKKWDSSRKKKLNATVTDAMDEFKICFNWIIVIKRK